MNAYLRTTVLLAALTALLLWAGSLMGGQQGLTMALMMALVMNFGAWWFSDKMVLAQYRAREVDESSAPDFYRIVRDLATRAQLPMPKVYVADIQQPNAFATGRNPKNAAVCATSGLLNMMTNDELAGVMAHELAHVKNRDTLTMTVAATIAGALGFMGNMGMRMGAMGNAGSSQDPRARSGALGALVVMLVGPIAASIVQFAISRTREYEADRIGASISGNPKALASALQKLGSAVARIPMPSAEANPATAHVFIANPLRLGGLRALFSTHPPMEERIRRLEQMTVAPGGLSGLGSRAANTQQQDPVVRRRSAGPWG